MGFPPVCVAVGGLPSTPCRARGAVQDAGGRPPCVRAHRVFRPAHCPVCKTLSYLRIAFLWNIITCGCAAPNHTPKPRRFSYTEAYQLSNRPLCPPLPPSLAANPQPSPACWTAYLRDTPATCRAPLRRPKPPPLPASSMSCTASVVRRHSESRAKAKAVQTACSCCTGLKAQSGSGGYCLQPLARDWSLKAAT